MIDATHITLVADRSGSMSSVQTDAQGAINTFIKEQQKVPGDATFKMVEFDAPGGGADWYHVVHNGDLQSAPDYELRPRGNTALLDAVARAIKETGSFLADKPEDYRPDKVIFVIQTDGQENSSQEYTWDAVAEMIKVQTEQYNWQFIFLGMGQDSWDQGSRLGVQNVVRSAASGQSFHGTHQVMNAYTVDYRMGNTRDMSAAASNSVNAEGQVFNAKGEEVDPLTGKVKDTPKA